MCFKGYAEVNVTDADRVKLQAFSKYLDDVISVVNKQLKECDKEQFCTIEKGFFRTRKCYCYYDAKDWINVKLTTKCKLPVTVKIVGHVFSTYDRFVDHYLYTYSHLKEPLRKLKSLFESDKVFLSDDLHEAWWEIKDSDWTPINELVEHLEGQV